jgi:hypothetical protein
MKERDGNAVHDRRYSANRLAAGRRRDLHIGAFVHVLLVIAVVLFIVGLLSGRRSLA